MCRVLLHNLRHRAGAAADETAFGEFNAMIAQTEALLCARYSGRS